LLRLLLCLLLLLLLLGSSRVCKAARFTPCAAPSNEMATDSLRLLLLRMLLVLRGIVRNL